MPPPLPSKLLDFDLRLRCSAISESITTRVNSSLTAIIEL
jgi:hypothetical protein